MEEEFLQDFNESHERIDSEGDSTFVPSGTISKPKRKRSQKARTVLHVWIDEECFQLIGAVESHRCIWDAGSAEYRNGRKEDGWREVVNEIGNGILVDDAKSKWMNLRAAFKNNIAKLRKTKSGQGSNESVKVNWRFFQTLMFLEANNVAISTESTSTMPSLSAAADRSLLNDLGVPSLPPTTVGQRKKRSAGTPTPSPTPSGSFNYKEAAAYALTNLSGTDRHAAFGEYIAAEMRVLPDADADALRQQFGRTLWDFLENRRIQTPQQQTQQPIQLTVRPATLRLPQNRPIVLNIPETPVDSTKLRVSQTIGSTAGIEMETATESSEIGVEVNSNVHFD